MVVQYHEELETDLRREGIDLLDFWRGTLSPRALEVAIRHLPMNGWFMRGAAPEAAEIDAWGPTDYLLADVFDLLVQINSSKPQRPYPRPADRVKRRQASERRAAALEAQNERIKAQRRQQ